MPSLFYLKSRDVSLAGATLAFDVDDQVIFGVSMDDEARPLLREMAQKFRASRGFMDCGVTSGNVRRSLTRFALPNRHHLACLLTNSPRPTNRRQRSRSYR